MGVRGALVVLGAVPLLGASVAALVFAVAVWGPAGSAALPAAVTALVVTALVAARAAARRGARLAALWGLAAAALALVLAFELVFAAAVLLDGGGGCTGGRVYC